MARVDYSGVPQATPQADTPDDYQHISTNPSQFGGGIAKGVEDLGQGVQHVGDFWGQIQTDKMVNDVNGNATALVEKFKTLRGDDALNAQAQYDSDLKEMYSTARGNLSSAKQQLAFDNSTRSFYQRFLQPQIYTHANQQGVASATETNNNGVKQSYDALASLNVDDPDYGSKADDAIARAVSYAEKNAHLQLGTSATQEQIAGVVRPVIQNALKTQAQAMSVTHPDRAMEFLNEHREQIGVDYPALAAQFKRQSQSQQVATQADDAVIPAEGGHPSADYYRANYSNIVQKSRDSAEKLFPGDDVFSDRVAARTEQKMNDSIRQQELSYKFDSDTVFRALDGSMTKGRAPSSSAEMEAISPQVANAWRNMQANNPQAAMQVETHLMTANSKGKAADYGTQFYQKLQAVLAPPSDPNYVNDSSKLLPYIGSDEGAPLTNSGFGQLGGILSIRGTPQGEAFTNQLRDFLNKAHGQISASDPRTGIVDPKGDARFNKFLVSALDNMKSEIGASTQPSAMFDPKSKNYIGQSIYGFIPTPAQKAEELMGYHNVYGPRAVSPEQTSAIDNAVKLNQITDEQGKSLLGVMRQAANGLITRRQAEQQAATILPSLLGSSQPAPSVPQGDSQNTEKQNSSGPPNVSDLMAPSGSAHTDEAQWDKRADGSQKGHGFLGLLRRPDGGVSSEISVGVNMGGKEVEIPTMVPTLTRQEVETLLKMDTTKDDVPQPILRKAIDFARQRIAAGKSPFAGADESPKAGQ